MIKHREMMKIISQGKPFSCTYVKRTGELTDFTDIKKFEKEDDDYNKDCHGERSRTTDHTKRRVANQYESLIPFQMVNGKIRELYTRCIVKFEGEEVVL